MKTLKKIFFLTLLMITGTRLVNAQKIRVVDSLPVMIYNNKPFIYVPTVKGQKATLKRSIGDSTGRYRDITLPTPDQKIGAYLAAIGRRGVDSLKATLKVSNDEALLSYINSHPELQSYGLFILDPKFAAAMGAAFVDSTLAKEKTGTKVFYELQTDTGAGPMILRGKFVVGQGVPFPKTKLINMVTADSTVKIQWVMRTAGLTIAPTAADLYLKEVKDPDFKPSNAFVYMEQKIDTAIFHVVATVKKGIPTAFFIRPTDMFGNKSAAPSDTVTAYIVQYQPMPVVGKVTVTDTIGGIRLSWPALDSTILCKGISIERSNEVGSGYAPIDIVGSRSSSYLDVSAKEGVLYYYRLSFISPDSLAQKFFGGYVGMAHISKAPLAPPYSVNTSVGSNHIKVTWSPVEGAGGYYVYRAATDSLTDISSISKLLPDTATSFIDTATTLSRRNFYYYVVRSVNNAGKESVNSTVAATKFPVGRDRMYPPTGLTLNAEDRYVHLQWDDMQETDAEIVSYNVYRRRQEASKVINAPMVATALTATKYHFEKLNAEPLIALAYDDMKWVDSIKYQYVISAVDNDGMESPLSATASTKSFTRRTVSLSTPKALTITKLTAGGVQLKWQNGDPALNVTYVIYRRVGDTGRRQKIATASTAAFIDKKVSSKQKYTYEVTAIFDEDEGPGADQSITL